MREQAFAIFRDSEISGYTFESLRLFMLMEATHWSHLPVAGGWYDQHPQFVDEVVTIFSVKAEVDREKERQRSQNNGPTHGPVGNL